MNGGHKTNRQNSGDSPPLSISISISTPMDSRCPSSVCSARQPSPTTTLCAPDTNRRQAGNAHDTATALKQREREKHPSPPHALSLNASKCYACWPETDKTGRQTTLGSELKNCSRPCLPGQLSTAARAARISDTIKWYRLRYQSIGERGI